MPSPAVDSGKSIIATNNSALKAQSSMSSADTPPRGGGGGRGALPSKRSYVSLDHFTNFSLPPRVQHPLAAPRRSRRTLAQQVWNKEKFVNAQYRFVMKPTEDYTVHFADPDIYFQWQDILQVIIPPSAGDPSLEAEAEQSSCPICLTSPPVAPRVTKCGHIFCFPCILRYLELGKDPKWNRCPICFDSVNESHLKCVRWDAPAAPSESFLPGMTLKMRLMERPHITTMALPRSHNWPSDLLPPHQAPFHFIPDVATFAKFMLATPDYLVANLMLELEELERERKLMTSGAFQDEASLVFVSAAERKVGHQIEKAAALESPTLSSAIKTAERLMKEQEQAQAKRESQKRVAVKKNELDVVTETPEDLLSVQATGHASSSSPPKHTPIPPRGPKSRKNVNPPPPPSSSSYFFYQAANGSPLFLHPLDSRILLSHFKSFAEVPDVIEFPTTTVTYTASTINDEVRKRYKYLSHLPEGADVTFVETGWELESIVGADGLKPFEGALKLRQGKRKEKYKKEERARVRAEEKDRDAAYQALTTWIPRSARERTPSPPPLSSPAVEVPSNPSGAWGNRSFASAIRNAPTNQQQRRERDRDREDEDPEWELAIDAAWRDLESSQRGRGGGGGGKKKGGKKLVILSSNGRGRY